MILFLSCFYYAAKQKLRDMKHRFKWYTKLNWFILFYILYYIIGSKVTAFLQD